VIEDDLTPIEGVYIAPSLEVPSVGLGTTAILVLAVSLLLLLTGSVLLVISH
jgi:hypothetical protein